MGSIPDDLVGLCETITNLSIDVKYYCPNVGLDIHAVGLTGFWVPNELRENSLDEGNRPCPGRDINRRLQKAGVETASSKRAGKEAQDLDICERTYYRCRKEFGGLKLGETRQLKELEIENGWLKRLVAELFPEKRVTCPVAAGRWVTLLKLSLAQ